jgi:DNA-binding GntR family transcriptional regulator
MPQMVELHRALVELQREHLRYRERGAGTVIHDLISHLRHADHT